MPVPFSKGKRNRACWKEGGGGGYKDEQGKEICTLLVYLWWAILSFSVRKIKKGKKKWNSRKKLLVGQSIEDWVDHFTLFSTSRLLKYEDDYFIDLKCDFHLNFLTLNIFFFFSFFIRIINSSIFCKTAINFYLQITISVYWLKIQFHFQ